MTLYLIGIGLWDKKDISVKGLEIIRNCKEIYLESYTSKLNTSISELEKFYGKVINIASREFVESHFNEVIEDAKNHDIALLIIGDVFSATTHIGLFLSAKKAGVKVSVIHNASIVSAIGIVGLEIYKFGKTTSIPFDNAKVYSPIEVLNQNREQGLHTLFLFDLDPKIDRFMSLREAISFLIDKGVDQGTKAVGIAGIGSEEPEIIFGKCSDIIDRELSKYPQCLIIPGKLHFMEEEALNVWDVNRDDNLDELPKAPHPEGYDQHQKGGQERQEQSGSDDKKPKASSNPDPSESHSEQKNEEDKSWKDYLKEQDLA